MALEDLKYCTEVERSTFKTCHSRSKAPLSFLWITSHGCELQPNPHVVAETHTLTNSSDVGLTC